MGEGTVIVRTPMSTAIVANAERITELSDTLTESFTEKARAVQESRGLKSLRSSETETSETSSQTDPTGSAAG